MINRERAGPASIISVAVGAVLLAGCASGTSSDTDMAALGSQLSVDGEAIVEEFRTNEPRMGEVTSETPQGDAAADTECDNGEARRVWATDFTVAWPGDATDTDRVDTLFDGTADFLAGRFRDRGYSAESQAFGDGAEPRSSVFRRTATDHDAELEFTVTYQLAPDQDSTSVTADFSLVGATPCGG